MLEKLPESVGEALQNQRAGLESTIIYRLAEGPPLARVEVRSSAFDAQRPLPERYTADGAGLSPPLEWRGVPESASQVVVVVEDADSPTPSPLVHAIVVLKDLRESSLVEGALNSPDHAGYGLQTGRNSFLSQAWLPPDPPPGHGVHRYVFQVFALREADLSAVPGRQEVFRAVQEHGLAGGYCIGTFGRGERVRAAEPDADAAVGAEAVPA